MRLATLLFILIFSGCNNGLLEIRIYNDNHITFDIEEDYINKFDEFKVNSHYRKIEDNSKVIERISYSFESKEPYRVDEQGNWYYRWVLTIETYDSYQSAVNSFNNKIKKMEDLIESENYMKLKGNNSRTIIIADKKYELSAGCKEGWHLQEWFEQLLSVILYDQKPEKNTIIVTNCGGSFNIQ